MPPTATSQTFTPTLSLPTFRTDRKKRTLPLSANPTPTHSHSLPTRRRRLPTLRLPVPSAPSPRAAATHLLVLSHGLQGTVEDFNYLLETFYASTAVTSGAMVVHASRVNTDKTHDGITLGGLRLAEDIMQIISEHPLLETISLIGFSLGGMYVRYAIGYLYDGDGLIGGLKAGNLFMVATPNLGVRSFGVYRFIPDGVLQMVRPFFGDTVKQLLCLDEDDVVERMTRGVYVRALRQFEKRYLYANVSKDFMVNYGTAALEEGTRELMAEKGGGGDEMDSGFDEKGCRVVFCKAVVREGGGAGGGAGGGVGRLGEMGGRLRDVGWMVVGVEFQGAGPISHNRIVAMSRTPFHSWLNGCGKRVVHLLVDQMCEHFDQHQQLFAKV